MKKKTLAIFVPIILLLIGLFLGYAYLYTKWKQPMGPALAGYWSGQPTFPLPTFNPTQIAIIGQKPTQNPEPTIQQEPLCGKIPILTVLGIGIAIGVTLEIINPWAVIICMGLRM
jgi:hypothetical protein